MPTRSASAATHLATPRSRWLEVGHSVDPDARSAGREAAAAARGDGAAKLLIVFCSGAYDREHRVLMLLSDGLAGDQQEIVRGAYGVLGAAVPLVGGCAGDDLQMIQTFQLHDGQVLSNAVVGVAIGSDAPLGIGGRHGWRRVRRFPIDILKIDKAFVDDLVAGDAKLAQAIIDLGNSFGLEVVAEGIEHERQRQRLLELGCRLGQGFCFARPVPAHELSALLAPGLVAAPLLT